MIIRAAVEHDINACVLMAEDFYQFTEYKEHIPYDADSTEAWFRFGLDQNLLFVADTGRDVVGFIIAVSSPFIMNKKYLAAAELAWWLDPDHRSGTAGIRLLKALEGGARNIGVKLLSMMSLESSEPEKIHRLYSARGFSKAETTYLKVLEAF